MTFPPREWALANMATHADRYNDLINFANWIVSLDDDDPESPGRQERRTITLTKIINRAKEALGVDPTLHA